MQNHEFVSDMMVQGMLHALTIRSPISSGSITEIICPTLPEEYFFITSEQIPGINKLADFPVKILSDKNLSYIGQPVAILAGPDKNTLLELADDIDIYTDEDEHSESEHEIIVERSIKSGQSDPAEGGTIVEGTYSTGIQEHWYSEPHGALVMPSPDGFIISTATQWPYHVKYSAAGVLGCESEKISVNPMHMSIHLDGKLWYPSLISCHAILASWVSKRAVKLMLGRKEDFLFSPKRNGSEIKIKSSLGEKGEILSSRVEMKLNLGAEGILENEIIDQTSIGSLGFYKHGDYTIEAHGLKSNIPPQGPMAGLGLSQGFFAAERHISLIADTLGHDPAEWRKNNFLSRDDGFVIGKNRIIIPKSGAPLKLLIENTARQSDFHRKWASYELLRSRRRTEKWKIEADSRRGIGISTAFQGNGFLHDEYNNCTVELTLEKDGSLQIKSGPVSSGVEEAWQTIAGDILGVDPSVISFKADTKQAPDSGPRTLSRDISIATVLVEKCCENIKTQRFRDPLPITVSCSNKQTEAFSYPGWVAAVVELEIDPVSMDPVIRGIWLNIAAGKIINKKQAYRTIHAGILQALGWTFREQVQYREGKISDECFRDYNISEIEDLPIFVDFFLDETEKYSGIGDLPFNCIPAAFVQAVSQAMDHPFMKIPLDSADIWDVYKMKNIEPSS